MLRRSGLHWRLGGERCRVWRGECVFVVALWVFRDGILHVWTSVFGSKTLVATLKWAAQCEGLRICDRGGGKTVYRMRRVVFSVHVASKCKNCAG